MKTVRHGRPARPRCRILTKPVLLPLVAVALLASLSGASADPPFKMIFDFCAQGKCAVTSRSELIRDDAGNLYSTSPYGGGRFNGAVFELLPNGSQFDYRVLYDFCAEADCRDGSTPFGSLIADISGALYGTTYSGGSANRGTVFELIPQASPNYWKLVVLYKFCSRAHCNDGKFPMAGLTYQGAQTGAPYDGTSPLYGTTTACWA